MGLSVVCLGLLGLLIIYAALGGNTQVDTAYLAGFGDTIGDPFKDTSGPALNILIKLMTMMSLVFAADFPDRSYDESRWWVAIVVAVFFLAIAFAITWWMRKTGFGNIDYGAEKIKPSERS